MITKTINIKDHETKIVLLPHHKLNLQETPTGYGRNLRTRTMIKYNNRWRRVKCCIYSNNETLYINDGSKDKWIVING